MKLVFLTIALLGLAACSEDAEEFTMPEVNDENCQGVRENIIQIEPKELRQEFVGRCLRRNRMVLGEPKEWGPSDMVLGEPKDIDERKR